LDLVGCLSKHCQHHVVWRREKRGKVEIVRAVHRRRDRA
jgi:hypothetical protein